MSCSKPINPDVVARVQKLLEQGNKGEQVVTKWEEIIVDLKNNDLVQRIQLRPDFVGIHSLNRSTFGIDGRSMNLHGGKIDKQGFSFKKAADATAVEPPIDPKELATEIDANASNVELSDGLLPALTAVKALSIGGANTNGFLRAVRGRAPTIIASCADASGCWDKDAMVQKCNALGEAADIGMWWDVIDRRCPIAWPLLVPVGINALNAKAGTEVSEVSVMLSLALSAAADEAAGKKVNWDLAKKTACANSPACEVYIDDLAAYVDACGGVDVIIDLADYVKCVLSEKAVATRILGGQFIANINALKFKGHTQKPLLKNAGLKAQLVCPVCFVEGGVCMLVKKSDIDKLKSDKNKANVDRAETMMQEAKDYATAAQLPPPVVSRLTGTFDSRVFLFLCGRGADSSDAKNFESLNEIGKARLARMLKL